ncbi:MAG: sulfatase [Deltaproteobacteria bacterium]|nr:sulfatase [Deltaproteobacteria bacterium]
MMKHEKFKLNINTAFKRRFSSGGQGALFFTALFCIVAAISCGKDKSKAHDASPSSNSTKSIDSAASDKNNNTKAVSSSLQTAPFAMPPFEKVLFVLVDALRADKLGCYGFNEPTSPAIDKLAKESVLFENVHAASPWTAPSFGTLFTGVSPSVHGAGKMLGKHSKSGKSVHGVTVGGIRSDLPTLAELMPDTMKKAAVINNSFVCKELGYAKGFDEFDFELARLTSYRTADEVTDIAINWLKKNKNKPFFYFLHYFDPHIQYAPPEKYLPMFAPNKPPRIAYPFVDHASARDGSLNPNDSEKAYIRGLYHAEVRFVDDELGRLLKYMKQEGLLENTWVVLISDHGEELFEHGSFDHGHRYEEEVTRVPWIVRSPGGKWNAGKRISYNVSHVDVFATMLALAGSDVPEHVEGTSVLPMVAGDETASRTSFMEFNLYRGQQCALFDGQFKLIYDVRRESSFLYDLKTDPMELTQLDKTHKMHLSLMSQITQKRNFLNKAVSGKTENSAVLSDESRDALKSLGYIE